MKNIFSAFVLCTICSFAYSQNVLSDTLTWNAFKAIGQANNDEVVYNSSFVIKGGQSLDWIQLAGARVYHYDITSSDGQWADVTGNGQVNFTIASPTLSGTATFSKSAEATTIHLNISAGGESSIDYVFYINTVEKGG